MTEQEMAILRRFVDECDLRNDDNWALIGDLYMELERGNATFVDAQFPGLKNLSAAMTKLLRENQVLQDRVRQLKHWHGKSDDLSSSDKRTMQKAVTGMISAIGNLADTFLGLIPE